MMERKVATVFGGSGFVGRHVVQRLRRRGFVVRVASRHPAGSGRLRTMGPTGEVVPLFASFSRPDTLARAIEGAQLVVNLVGILAEQRAGDFHRVHAEGPGRIASASTRAGVEALVQVSAIGADPDSDSLYARSKAAGERAVLDAFPAATIIRPSLVFGPEDKFFNRFASLARLSPVMPVFFGDTRMQPVYVGDVADAIDLALTEKRAGTYELGGPDIMRFRDILTWILRETRRRRPQVEVPAAVAFLQAAIAERLPGRPLTRDQLRLLRHDNVVSDTALGFASLGLTPASIELVVPSYLARYRAGGGRRRVPA